MRSTSVKSSMQRRVELKSGDMYFLLRVPLKSGDMYFLLRVP